MDKCSVCGNESGKNGCCYSQDTKGKKRDNMDIKINSVYENKETGLKFIIHKGNKFNVENTIEKYNFVCSNPHDDGDYSYLCCSEYCRCQQ